MAIVLLVIITFPGIGSASRETDKAGEFRVPSNSFRRYSLHFESIVTLVVKVVVGVGGWSIELFSIYRVSHIIWSRNIC